MTKDKFFIMLLFALCFTIGTLFGFCVAPEYLGNEINSGKQFIHGNSTYKCEKTNTLVEDWRGR